MAARIVVVCPKCGHRMGASAEHIGRQGKCPNCKALLEIRPSGEQSSLTSIRPDASGRTTSNKRDIHASTEVSPLVAGAIGLVVTLAFYALLFLVRNSSFGRLFLQSGSVAFITSFFFFWGLAVLGMKYLAVKQQVSYAELELELIPLEIGVNIAPNNVEQFLQHLAGSPQPQRLSILGRRIQGALEHFRSRNSVPEVQQYLATQAEIDSSQVDAGYTLLRSLIWAIPILGFIGTVVGISAAVSGLNETMGGGSAEGSALMLGMKQVTAGLSTAFDTTLIALTMAVMLLFPTESLRKAEYRMLDRIETFSNESLLRRMVDDADELDELPRLVRDALEASFQEHQRWLVQWQTQVAQLGELIGRDFEVSMSRIQDDITKHESMRLDQVSNLHRMLESFFSNLPSSAGGPSIAIKEAADQLQRFLDVHERLYQSLHSKSVQVHDSIDGTAPTIFAPASDGQLIKQLTTLCDQIKKLTEKLDRRLLNSELTLAETHPLPQTTDFTEVARTRTGWFGRFRTRRN